MKARVGVLLASLGLLAAVAPLYAHHSFAAEYDNTKPIALTGTVTKVEWMNPHARFYLDMKDDKGTVTNWEFELGSPNGLARRIDRRWQPAEVSRADAKGSGKSRNGKDRNEK